MKRNRRIGGVDRISGLPEPIVHEILSRLSSKEVAQTCVLSKTWYHLKRSYPVLGFQLPNNNNDGAYSDSLIIFSRFVCNSLQHFSSNEFPLQALNMNINIFDPNNPHLYLFFYQPNNILVSNLDKLSSHLDTWIILALAKGVKELNLCAKMYKYPVYYTLPQPLFCSKTLTSLQLTSCLLDLPISIFTSLRKLAIYECSLGGPIILKGTVLEELTVKRCSGNDFKTIYISGLDRLHSFALVNFPHDRIYTTVEISSPIIQSIAIRSFWSLPAWSLIYNIHGCNSLKILYLESKELTDAELHSLLLNVPLLEELYLFDCHCLTTLEISSPLLKTLEIFYLYLESSLNHIHVSSPNLENLIYKSCNLFTSKPPRIMVADCCRSLKTLVFLAYLFNDNDFQKLLSRFPLLENLWIIDCKWLQRINVPNLQLKRLHIVDCAELKAVKVSSPNLCEFCYTDYEVPRFSVADDVYASGLKVECGGTESLLRLEERMKNFVHVKDESFLNQITLFPSAP